jgi:asparagine synthase (glutamine-hydrolysing)
LMNATFPNYYYSRTSNPYRYSENGMSELYTADFGRSIDREYTVQPLQKLFSKVKDQGILDQMLYIDTKTWLPDDLLIKADKMTMANSLELRVPLLDHKVLEFAASLPAHYKLRGLSLKYLLKRALAKRVPRAILKRKKAGFPVPYDSWMRGDLKGWLSGILLDRETSARGYFRKSIVEKLLAENASSGMYSKELFSLAVLELWHRQFLGNQSHTTDSPCFGSREVFVIRA